MAQPHTMTNAIIENREDPAFAASVMERLCPSPADRFLVLQQLLASIEIAKQISPDVWAVTLFNYGFRLNVGQVEAMTYSTIVQSWPFETPENKPNLFEIRLLLHGEISSSLQQFINEDSDTHEIISSNYKSVPAPQSYYSGLGELSSGVLSSDSHRKIEMALRLAAPLHAEFIRLAAHSPSGAVRKASSFRRTHSPGLYAYAQSFVRENSMAPSASNGKAPGVEENWSFQEELPPDEPLVEGAGIIVKVSAFERNLVARRRCIAHYGGTCVVCGFSFGAAYGSAADGYVHVHHLMPLASIGKEYVVDPVKDLRPVCPNCHAVIHRRQPPYSIEEVKRMLRGEATRD
jgi:hypothetical protein